jgi:hypothetical protein
VAGLYSVRFVAESLHIVHAADAASHQPTVAEISGGIVHSMLSYTRTVIHCIVETMGVPWPC